MSALLALAFATLPCQEPVLDAKVAFSCSPTRLENLLPELSKRVGTRLTTTVRTKDEVVVLHVRDIPGKEIMRRLAEATNAEWQRAEGGYRLDRTPERERREAAEELAAKVAGVRNVLKAVVKDLPPPMDEARARALTKSVVTWTSSLSQRIQNEDESKPPSEEETHRQAQQNAAWATEVQRQIPAKRHLVRLMEMVPLEMLLDVPEGERSAFATVPTRMQRPLPPKTAELMTEFSPEYAALEQAAAGLRNSDGGNWVNRFAALALGLGAPLAPRARTVLVVDNTADGESRVLIHVINPDSQQVTFGGHVFKWSDIFPARSVFTPEEANLPVAFSELAKTTLQAALHSLENKRLSEALRTSLAQALSDPVRLDPHAHTGAQGLQGLGLALKENLIAVVPDAAIVKSSGLARYFFGPTGERVLTAGQYETFLHDAGMRLTREDGWLTVRPLHPSFARRRRSDRALMRRLYAPLAQQRTPPVEELVAIAGTPRAENLDDLHPVLTAPLLRGWVAHIDPNTFRSLGIYASLSPSQREAVLAGTEIPVAAFSPATRRRVEDQLFRGRAGGVQHITLQDASQGAGIPDQIPSESFPEGLAGNTRLRFGLIRSPMFVRPGEPRPVVVAAHELGKRAFQREQNGQPPYESLDYALALSNSLYVSVMTDRHNALFPPLSHLITLDYRRLLPLNAMPEWVKEEMRQGYERAKKADGG